MKLPLLQAALAGSLAALAALVPPAHHAATEQAPQRVAQPGTVAHGREIYETAGCASCHATTLEQEAKDGLLRAGHPLEGAAYRGTWWNGRITTDAGDASEFCLRAFIDPNSEGFTAEERKALVLFMQALGTQRGISPMVLLRRDAGDVDLSSGDPGRGREIYRRACLSCHGDAKPFVASVVRDLSPAQVAGVVRRGSGTMAFFQVDRLTAPQVADAAAYIESLKPPP